MGPHGGVAVDNNSDYNLIWRPTYPIKGYEGIDFRLFHV